MKYTTIAIHLILDLMLVGFGAMGLFFVMPDPRAAWAAQEGFTPEAVVYYQ